MAFRKNKFTQDVEEFRKIVSESFSIREVRTRLGYKESGGIYKYLKRAFDEFKIDISHFNGQLWNKGKSRSSDERVDKAARRQEIPWKDAFAYGSSIGNAALLKRLIEAGTRKYCCEKCKISSWQDQPVRLQLDHKNGDSMDNREENLTILCPNCHSQTPTFSLGTRAKCKKTVWWEKYCNVPVSELVDDPE